MEWGGVGWAVRGEDCIAAMDTSLFTDEEVEQVTKIQALARGRAVREAQRMKSARGSARSARSDAPSSLGATTGYTDEELESIVKIQSAARGRATRASLKAIREQQLKAEERFGVLNEKGELGEEETTRLEEMLTEFTVEEEEKIVQIQALARGRAARLKAKQDKARARGVTVDAGEEITSEAIFSKDDIESITKIQAAARGRAVRRTNTQTRLSKSVADQVKSDEVGDGGHYTAEEEAQIVKIQAAARGRAVRKARAAGRAVSDAGVEFSKEEMESITKIQAVARGRAVRAANQNKRASVRAEVAALRVEDEVVEVEDDMPGEEDFTADEQLAIVRIQAAARGLSERKRLAETKSMSAQELAKAKAEGAELVIELTPEEEASVTRIQAVARGRKARRETAELMAEMKEAQEAATKEAARERREGLNPRKYLDEYLVKGVRRALAQLVVDRPADPFFYLADLIEAQSSSLAAK